MLRATRAIVLAACLTGCGAFLGLGEGVDDDDATPPTGDASADGGILEGGDSSVSIIDDDGGEGGGGGANLDGGAPDAAKDASADATTNSLACNGKQACERYVFVTSKTFAGDFGAANANEECRKLADATTSLAELKGRAWRAWVSTSTRSAAQNLEVAGTSVYKRVDGETIAATFLDLADGALAKAIDRDENGSVVLDAQVWTATAWNGTHIPAGCNGFAAAANGFAKVGNTGATNGAWTDSGDWSCALTARLYCFEY